MKSILEELYYGNISPDETVISTDPEYRLLNRKITEAVEKWKTKLTEQDFEELEDLLYLCAQSDSLQTRAAFQHGFKLGSAILIEVMTGKEELVRHKS
ncbi:hypothetical protein JI735_03730 [Paenibacillus sonchi]|uniref:Uncharacterized protein n=1 Tax=Paenibacillus sonchi TaxID=373687 RepID=A0A974PDG5_9BACL|nr:DUF6809 family protein [Paenibacillus sonchi]QQZ61850.1 hypothetical protein JI735_03730 [Paenibacillus sonchi]